MLYKRQVYGWFDGSVYEVQEGLFREQALLSVNAMKNCRARCAVLLGAAHASSG